MKNIELVIEQHAASSYNTPIMFNQEVFRFYDCGLTRNVYVNSDFTKVIKLPINRLQTFWNEEEFEVYENAVNKEMMAKTEKFGDFIVQEFVEPIKYSDKRLTIKQTLFAAKCRNEVGFDKDGNLKCFDLSEFCKY